MSEPVRRALVTGASGQDGSYLVETLREHGVDVHALDGDVTDVLATRQAVLDLEPDAVFNLAALSSVARSWQEPDRCAAVNGTAAVALLESAWLSQERTGRPVRFVQASSAEMFGQPASSPQSESTPLRPINPYGAAKAYAHLMVDVYRRRGLHASSLILYNHESPRRPTHFVTRKITSTVAAIARGEAERLVLGSLDTRRDWGWAPDYVGAMLAAAEADSPDDYVIATGVSSSIGDFARSAFAHVGIDDWRSHIDLDPALTRPADATELVGDATKAYESLGWHPTKTLDEIVAAMVDADLDG